MRGTKLVITVLLVASVPLVAATGSVAAAEVGASGSCDDSQTPGEDMESNGDGGDGAVRVSSDGDADLAGADEVIDFAEGITWFVQYSARNDRLGCDDSDGSDNPISRDDYFEAHADTGNGAAVQVCFDETTGYSGNPVLIGEETDHDGDNDDRDCEYDHHDDPGGQGDSDP